MKKITLGIFISMFLFVNVNANENSIGNIRLGKEIQCSTDDQNRGCSQCFESRTLRFGYSYSLFDNIRNPLNNSIYIDKTSYTLSRGLLINNKGQANKLKYSDWIKGKKYILNGRESGELVSIEDFSIDNLPANGRKSNNIVIDYITRYQNIINGKPTGVNIEHKECQPYSISWCGDGVLDREYDETCDPKDPTKKGWGTGGCDNTCKPVVKNATCDSLVANPTTGIGSLTTNFTCSGTNATNFKIDLKNRGNLIHSITGKTGSYTFNLPGTYTAKCYADNNSSASCEQVITVKPKPEGECVALEVSKVQVEKGQKATFTCEAKNTENYKIKIVNENGQLVNQINGRIGEFTFPDKGTYIASCYVDDKTTTKDSCVKPLKVVEPIVPNILVDKRDENPKDKDGIIGNNDSQTIDVKDPAIFKITATNNGTEELKDIFLKDNVIESDVDAPKCEKSIDEVNTILRAKFGRTTLKPGESFDYTCERPNDPKDPDSYTNEITVEGTGITSLKKVKSKDPTKVYKSKDPKIKVDKRDNNPNDLDKIIGDNDSQTIEKEGTAIFKITATNNGTEDLENVFLKDDVLKSDIDAPSCDKSIDEVNSILKTIGNRDNIFNIGETFEYTCERKNVSSDNFPYTNTIDITGTGVTSKKTVKDNDPTVVKTPEKPGIKVDKRDENKKDKDGIIGDNDSQTIDQKDDAIFKITVRNNGLEDLEKIKLEDDVLNNDTDAPKCEKSIEQVNTILQAKFGRTILKPGESFDYTCERPNAPKDPVEYTNRITVFGVSVTGKPVKDHDDTVVKKQTSCENLTVSKTSGEKSFTSDFTCKGTGNKFEIFVKDNNGKILEKISGKTGSYTFNQIGRFNVECQVDDKKVEEKCSVPVTVTEPNVPGNSPARCEYISPQKISSFPTNQDFTCKGSGSSDYELYVNGSKVAGNNNGIFRNIRINSGSDVVECRVGGLDNSNGQCTATVNTSGTPPPPSTTTPPIENEWCGDGKVQRGRYYIKNGRVSTEEAKEECDSKELINGKRWCSDECKLAPPETIPGESFFKFFPETINVIGKKMNPYKTYNSVPHIVNKSLKSSLYVEQICVTTKSKFNTGTSFDNKTFCSYPADSTGRIVKEFNPGTTLYMKDKLGLDDFIAKSIKSGVSFEDNVLVTTVVTGSESEKNAGGKIDNPIYQDTYFLSSAKKFKVRVAKGSVATVGGGTSYLSENNKNISDSKEVTKDTIGEGKNNNFVGASLTDFLTSYSKNISSEDAIKKAKKYGENFEKSNNINVIGENNDGNQEIFINNQEIKEYNGITGTKIIKNKNLVIKKDDIKSKNGDTPTTYIIENGDLIINGDIKFGANIAFVVKGGNIKFEKDVKYVEGTYIAIKYGIKGGNIKSALTTNQLVVSGSLYGNISDLTEKRTYLKVNDKGQLDVGTVVSYNSNAFSKPAPLVATFIEDYMKSTKVAK